MSEEIEYGEMGYMTKDFAEKMKKWQDEAFARMFFPEMFPPRIAKEDDNIKLAWVYIGNKRDMLGVDNVTMKGYKMNKDTPTWKIPLEEQSYDTFERWCTGFDV